MTQAHRDAKEDLSRTLDQLAREEFIRPYFPETLDRLPVVFSGGMINILTQKPFGDIDIFIYDPNFFTQYDGAWRQYAVNSGSALNPKKVAPWDMNSPALISRTFNSLSLEIPDHLRNQIPRDMEQRKLNVIVPDRYIHPMEISSSFDLMNAQWYYNLKTKEMHLPDYVFDAVINSRLEIGNHFKFYTPGEEPIRVKRLLKYERRGYVFSKEIANFLGKNQGLVQLVRKEEKERADWINSAS